MSYTLVFSDSSLKQLKKLDKPIQEHIISVLKRCTVRPFPHVKRLVGVPYFRIRAGDYRIIVDVKENALAILVIEIGHRKNIYAGN